MIEVKHTPGPWHVDPKSPEESFFEDVSILRGDGLAVAVALHNGDILAPEPEANARLIAAAPDLLDALKDLLAELDEDDVRLSSPIYEALKAIAKAEGK